MRIVLKRGKQKELIEKAKERLSWLELSNKLGLAKDYIRNELRKEKVTLSKETFKILCEITKEDYSNFITNKLNDNWGKVKGGINSQGSTIELNEVKFDEKLAEFVGATLGDGNVASYKKGKKKGVYGIRIAGDYKKDRNYHMNYLKKLCESIFNLKAKESLIPEHNERFLVLHSKRLVELFNDMGIKHGNKIKNQSTIPKWIFSNSLYLKSCIRGLIDTDGSVFRMSNKDPNLIRISFTNHNFTLLNDTRMAFIKLDFSPSKVIKNREFFISRKENIQKYLKEIGFSNLKHIKRLQKLKSRSVAVKSS